MGTGERRLKRLIVTGDDFGLSLPINEAIEQAHTNGILTTTCLMMSGAAVADAVARARRLPELGVGLHVVAVCGRPVLPIEEVSGLVGADGRFDDNLIRAGFRYFFLPHVRQQLEAEIRAQFQAFRETGLALDHANAHNHMHIHPTLLGTILRIGREFGLKAVRVPFEPDFQGRSRSLGARFVAIWIDAMKRRVRKQGLRYNEYIFGLENTGQMDRDHILPIIKDLPDGVSEIFSHPATGRWDGIDPVASDYRFEAEFAALIDEDVRVSVEASGAQLISYRDI